MVINNRSHPCQGGRHNDGKTCNTDQDDAETDNKQKIKDDSKESVQDKMNKMLQKAETDN